MSDPFNSCYFITIRYQDAGSLHAGIPSPEIENLFIDEHPIEYLADLRLGERRQQEERRKDDPNCHCSERMYTILFWEKVNKSLEDRFGETFGF